jgi:hypothetical protein
MDTQMGMEILGRGTDRPVGEKAAVDEGEIRHKLATSPRRLKRTCKDFCGFQRRGFWWQKRRRKAVSFHSFPSSD